MINDHSPSAALTQFNSELDTASDNIGAVGASVSKARDAVVDVELALGVFGRVEGKADEVADIIDGVQTVAKLLGKFGPLKVPMKLLGEVLEQIENGVEKVEKAAGDIDTNQLFVDLKQNAASARTKLEDIEEDIQDAQSGFDERRTPLKSAEETLNDLSDLGSLLGVTYVSDLGDVIDDILDPNGVVFDPDFDPTSDPNDPQGIKDGMLDYTVSINDLFTGVDSALTTFNSFVDNNPLREALEMEAKLCAIVDKLQDLKRPLEVIEKAVGPVEWVLDASEAVIDAVLGPILDPLMEALGVDRLVTTVGNAISSLLPDLDDFSPFGSFDVDGNLLGLGSRLTNLGSQINVPNLDLNAHLNLSDFFDDINLTLDVSNFSLPGFQIGGDGDDTLEGDASNDILSGGLGFDWLRGGSSNVGSFISGGIDSFVAGLGNDLITGNWSLFHGADDPSAPDDDAVVFSGNLGEYFFEMTQTVTETINGINFERAAEVVVTHGPTIAGQVSDGIDRIQGVKNYIFQDQELTREDLSNIETVDNSGPDMITGTSARDFILAGSVTTKSIIIDGLEDDDYILGGAKADIINGGIGNDLIDGGANEIGAFDTVNGGADIDRLTFASSVQSSGQRVDLGEIAGDRTTSPFNNTVTATSIEHLTGSQFGDVFLGRDTHTALGAATYVEQLSGGAGSDLLRGFGDDDRLEGGDGNDALIGDGGSNLLFGGRGDDIVLLDPTAGVSQTVDGGAGFDRVSYDDGTILGTAGTLTASTAGWASVVLAHSPVSTPTSGVRFNAETGTARHLNTQVLDRFESIEAYVGTSMDDTFLAELTDRNAMIHMDGFSGDDTFRVGTGKQILDGGDGNDTVVVTGSDLDEADAFDGGAGIDRLDLSNVTDTRWHLSDENEILVSAEPSATDDRTVAPPVMWFENRVAASITGFEEVFTGNGDDDIRMNVQLIDSGGGNDLVYTGGVENQIVRTGTGRDGVLSFFAASSGLYDLGVGNDFYFGRSADGRLTTIIGGPDVAPSDDVSDDDAFLVQGPGAFDLFGGFGQDTVSFRFNGAVGVIFDLANNANNAGGAAGVTTTSVENVSGSIEDDIIFGDSVSNLLAGGGGDDSLFGLGVAGTDEADDPLYGNEGDDTLDGGQGDDLLHGGTGHNLLLGSAGIDTAAFTASEARPVGDPVPSVLNELEEGETDSFNNLRFTANLQAQVSADLSVLDSEGLATATRTRVLHYDDFESGVGGYFDRPGNILNPTSSLPGFGTFLGPNEEFAGSDLFKVLYAFGQEPIQDVTVSFDFIEIDSWAESSFTATVRNVGSISIEFNNGVPVATSGVSDDMPWTVETLPGYGINLGFGSAVEHAHRITLTFTPQFNGEVELGFGMSSSSIGPSADDLVGIDNLLLTTSGFETDKLSSIENLLGGNHDDTLVGDAQDNLIAGDAGDDTIRGLAGNDELFDGEGADQVYGGDNDDLVFAGTGSRDGRGDSYDGGAGFDVLDYSGLEGPLIVHADGRVAKSYSYEEAVWADDGTKAPRIIGSDTYTPNDLYQAFKGSAADGADDFSRFLELPNFGEDNLEDYTLQSVATQATDTTTGFEKVIGGSGGDLFIGDGGDNQFDGGAGDDVLVDGLNIDTLVLNQGAEVGQYATLGNFTAMPSGSLTLEMLYKSNGPLDPTGPDLIFFSYEQVRNDILIFGFPDGGAPNFGLRFNSTEFMLTDVPTSIVMDGQAHRISVIFDIETDMLSLWIDGVEMYSGSPGPLSGIPAGGTLVFGQEQDGILGNFNAGQILPGEIADVRIWDGVRSAVEIQENAFTEIADPMGEASLVANWRPDGTVGTVPDATGGAGLSLANYLAGPLPGFSNLSAGGGNDMMSGGDGNDTLDGGIGDDTLDGGTGDDSVQAGTGDDSVVGGEGNDRIAGLEGADTLFGQDGDDTINGGNGDDQISGGVGDNVLRGQGGGDDITATTGSDTIAGGSGEDVIAGGSGNDDILGQSGNDDIAGDAGNDTLSGGSGNDTINGGSDDDSIIGQGNNDVLIGGGGNDTLSGASGLDTLMGGAGDDLLLGGNGRDRLDGGSGNDTLSGGTTDAARDDFVFMLGYDSDRINGFDQAGADKLLLDESLWLVTHPLGLSSQEVIDTFGVLNGNSTILTLDFGDGDILEIQSAAGLVQSTLGTDVVFV